MLNLKDIRILQLIKEHCSSIEEVVSNLTEEEFLKDKVKSNSVCFDILQIGELTKSFTDTFLSKYDGMPWKDIKGMRDWVAHGYHNIEITRIWQTAKKDIPSLCNYCESVLKENKIIKASQVR